MKSFFGFQVMAHKETRNRKKHMTMFLHQDRYDRNYQVEQISTAMSDKAGHWVWAEEKIMKLEGSWQTWRRRMEDGNWGLDETEKQVG